MRRLICLLLVVLMAVPAVAYASHRDPKRQINPVDQRKALAIVLKRTDFVAGWTKKPSTPDDDTHLDCPGYDPNGADLVVTGEAEADFRHTRGFPTVFSFANIYKSRAQAATTWKRSVKPALASCLANLLKKTMEADGARVAITRQGGTPFPKVAPRTAAFRVQLGVAVTENGKTTTLPLTMYVIAIGNGRGEAGLMTMSFGTSLRQSDVETFARLTAQRLGALKL